MTYASKGVSANGRERSFSDTGHKPGFNPFNAMAVAGRVHVHESPGTESKNRT